MKILLDVLVLITLVITPEKQSLQSSFDPVEPYHEIFRYSSTKFGETMPTGWIREQIQRDLTEGYIGQFDKVDHTVTHNLFVNQNRRSNKRYHYDRSWWSGEHEGYWKDAVLRMAYLTENEEYIHLAKHWIYDILAHTGEDGYIGIYEKCDANNCRFHHDKENGELWTTSRILMPMLAFYEISGDTSVLNSIIKATNLVIDKYTLRNYFINRANKGGVSHGIGFFENLEWLYRITGDTLYSSWAVKLYKDFNGGIVRDDDLKTELLLDEKRYFRKHGAHIAEGFFVPAYIAELTDDPVHRSAAKNAYKKLLYHLTPGGAMRADEFINGREGSADEKYEYCGITEIINPLQRVFTYSNDFGIGDRIETMTFNAGQGARFPVLKALSYISSDNRIHIRHASLLGRERYDANHKAAACCVLNGGRLMPYYVEGMWFKYVTQDGIAAFLYGPNTLNTTINNTNITIDEKTNYPFSDEITFEVQAEQEVFFEFALRIPYNCQQIEITGIPESQVTRLNDRILIKRTWTKNDRFSVHFKFDIRKVVQEPSSTVKNGGFFFRRGPLVYALPVDYHTEKVKEYKGSGFYRYKIRPVDISDWYLKLTDNPEPEYAVYQSDYPVVHPWEERVNGIHVNLTDKKGVVQRKLLVPMGNTIFRRVVFEVN